jgi:hypothetical protein
LKWVLYECTLEDVSISIVVFSKTVRDADNWERRRSSLRS